MRTDVGGGILTLWAKLSKWQNWERETESCSIAIPVGDNATRPRWSHHFLLALLNAQAILIPIKSSELLEANE